MTRLAIIGTGRLGTTLLRAAAAYAPELALSATARRRAPLEALRREIPSLTIGAPEEIIRAADLVLPCVPPGAYRTLIASIAPHLAPDAILVSVTNGVPLAAIAEHVRAPVVKVIATIAHTVGRGVSLLTAGPGAQPEHIETVRRVFARFSLPVVVPEQDDRVASNIAGSALALFAMLGEIFVAANARRAVALDRAVLDAMMAETLAAIAALMQSGHSWHDIVAATATPGGMTQAALDVLAGRFPDLAEDMVAATFARQAAIAGAPHKP
jgi:pyrroline-5-carboxylate reductase